MDSIQSGIGVWSALASHPSAEHCISNALTLTKFRVVGIISDNFICFGVSQKASAFSPAKKITTPFLFTCTSLGQGKGRTGLHSEAEIHSQHKKETCLVDFLKVCLS